MKQHSESSAREREARSCAHERLTELTLPYADAADEEWVKFCEDHEKVGR